MMNECDLCEQPHDDLKHHDDEDMDLCPDCWKRVRRAEMDRDWFGF